MNLEFNDKTLRIIDWYDFFVLVCVTICCVYQKQGTNCVGSTFTPSETRVHVQKAHMCQACPHQWRNKCSAPPHICPSHLRWFEDVQGYQSFALLHFFLLLPGCAGACSELFSCSSP